MRVSWDQVGEREYEVGVDRGVLYLPDNTGAYNNGFAWNGLVTVTESPSGGDATPQYADNIKYLNLTAAQQFGGTIDAFTYPDEFAECDGTAVAKLGVRVGQQNRKHFGLCYRTRVGNDVDGTDLGYKLHLVYGALAAPSDKAYGTINDTPSAMTFSWTFTTTPVEVTNLKPTALITVDSTEVTPAELATLEDILYGTDTPAPGVAPRLPLPDEVISMFTTPAPALLGEPRQLASVGAPSNGGSTPPSGSPSGSSNDK